MDVYINPNWKTVNLRYDNGDIFTDIPSGLKIIGATRQGDFYYLPPMKIAASVISEVGEMRYRSQWDVDANNRSSDCGQACVAMIAEQLGHPVPINSIQVGSPKGLTSADDLIKALSGFGIPAVKSRKPLHELLRPSICLVKYGSLSTRMDTFDGLHWVVFLGRSPVYGEAIVMDPDFWDGPSKLDKKNHAREEGDKKRYSKFEFGSAMYLAGNLSVEWVI